MPLSTQAATRKDQRTEYADMQHRHFATIATIIRDLPDDQRDMIAVHFADRLHRTNGKFDATRFMGACK